LPTRRYHYLAGRPAALPFFGSTPTGASPREDGAQPEVDESAFALQDARRIGALTETTGIINEGASSNTEVAR
jgi:hypothetical protein